MAERKLIKNSVVSMDWYADRFYETRADGFFGAEQDYATPNGNVAVGFTQNQAFILSDGEGGIGEHEDILKCLKDCLEYEEQPWEGEYEAMCVVLDSGGFDMLRDDFGFTEDQIKDIQDRLADLSGYYYVETVDAI